MAEVTVVTTTFQRPDYLRKALGSLQAQTFTNFQVLVCDNANDPAVAELVAGYADERFLYLGRPENLGLMRNAIEGFKSVTTEFAVKLDDDDEFDEKFLEVALAGFRAHPDVVVSFGDRVYFGPQGEPLPEQQQVDDGFRDPVPPGYLRPFEAMVLNGGVQLNAAVLRTDAVDWDALSDETGPAFDMHVLLEAAGNAGAAWYDPQARVRYRIHPGSDTAQRLAIQLRGRIACLDHALTSTKAYDRAALQNDRVSSSVQLARELIRTGEPGEARQVLSSVLGAVVRPDLLRVALLSAMPRTVAQRWAQSRLNRWQQSVNGSDSGQ